VLISFSLSSLAGIEGVGSQLQYLYHLSLRRTLVLQPATCQRFRGQSFTRFTKLKIECAKVGKYLAFSAPDETMFVKDESTFDT